MYLLQVCLEFHGEPDCIFPFTFFSLALPHRCRLSLSNCASDIEQLPTEPVSDNLRKCLTQKRNILKLKKK